MNEQGYHYTGCGLDNVWLCNGYTLHEDAYGQSVSIDNLDSLHRAIGSFLADKAAPLTGAEARFLRIEMDLSQKRLGELLGRDAQTIALWEKNDGPALGAGPLLSFWCLFGILCAVEGKRRIA